MAHPLFPLGQTARGRAKEMMTQEAPQPLEWHFPPSKTAQQQAALGSLRMPLVAPTSRAGLPLLLESSNGLFEGFGSLAALPACSIWLSSWLSGAVASNSIVSETITVMRGSDLSS